MDFAEYARDLDRLRPAEIGVSLPNLAALSRIDSTNRVARTVAASFESEGLDVSPLLVLAFEQTGGRGRQGRSWSSPRGKGVYATLLLPLAATDRLETLPLLVGVGLCRALQRHLAPPCRLKWPNDLVVEFPSDSLAPGRSGRRKVGGVLIEATIQPESTGAAFIGFGVNHDQRADELPAGATSLRLAAADEVSLPALTWELTASVLRELEHLGDAAYTVAAYRELSIHRPGDRLSCRVGDRLVEGTFRGFDDRGLLLLASDEGEQRIAAGEVIE
ncbi:MAG TPA: biotin--[acetyl-CoA-carboxylase] ligase [Thermoanaerobaculia bacterium]